MSPGRPHDDTGRREADAALRHAWHTDRLAVLATVARRLGDLQLAEDAVQEAFAAATVRWAADGVPERPGAWLSTTAWRKAVDRLRRDRFPVTRQRSDTEPGSTPPAVEPAAIDARLADDLVDPVVRHDDVLSLVLACCHPALNPEAQIALTLRHVVGLTDRQIAARFLVLEPTMTKRLVRARAKIRDARIGFALPDRTRLHDRLDEVRTVIYLIFTEGYLSTGGEAPIRAALCDEALWLARQLHRLAPEDPETTGLLALIVVHHARTAARQDDTGRLIPYAEQDRGRWDSTAIDGARNLLATTAAPAAGQPGAYRLQAAIALLHATAPTGREPPWALIADLYAALHRAAPSPVVTINHAVALGRAGHPRAGLRLLHPVLADPRLADYLPLHAAHADLLHHAGDPRAATVWRHAADLATNPHQRQALLRRADPLGPGPDGPVGCGAPTRDDAARRPVS